MTQRRLEVEPTPAPPTPEPGPTPEVPMVPTTPARPADLPIAPSNRALLDRQLRWQRERAKFESSQTDAPTTK